MTFPSLYFKESKGKGQGVFAEEEIVAETIIEKCPTIIISTPHEINLAILSCLKNYAFRWDDEQTKIAIALGFGSLYNHSSFNNARHSVNEADNTIDIVAVRNIKPNEEVTISYVGAKKTADMKWFKDRGIELIE